MTFFPGEDDNRDAWFLGGDDDDSGLLDIRALLKTEWVTEYDRLREMLYLDMVALEQRMLILEHLSDFPYWVFLVPEDSAFWNVMYNTLVESVITGIFRSIVDARDDVLTIEKFKTEVQDHLFDENAKQSFHSRVQGIDFTGKFAKLKKQIFILRNNRVGHSSIKYKGNNDIVSFIELRALLVASEELFNSLCSPTYRSFVAIEFMPHPEREHPLDKLFNSIVNNSPVIHAPEDDPGWPFLREKFSDVELQIFNRYRKRLHLPTVD